MPGVAAADVQPVEMGERPQRLDGASHATVPTLIADRLPRRLPELLVIGFAVAKRDVERSPGGASALHRRGEPSRSPYRASRRLRLPAAGRSQALHVGIVDDAHRLLPELGERIGEVEPRPPGPEVRRRQHLAVTNHARKTYRYADDGGIDVESAVRAWRDPGARPAALHARASVCGRARSACVRRDRRWPPSTQYRRCRRRGSSRSRLRMVRDRACRRLVAAQPSARNRRGERGCANVACPPPRRRFDHRAGGETLLF